MYAPDATLSASDGRGKRFEVQDDIAAAQQYILDLQVLFYSLKTVASSSQKDAVAKAVQAATQIAATTASTVPAATQTENEESGRISFLDTSDVGGTTALHRQLTELSEHLEVERRERTKLQEHLDRALAMLRKSYGQIVDDYLFATEQLHERTRQLESLMEVGAAAVRPMQSEFNSSLLGSSDWGLTAAELTGQQQQSAGGYAPVGSTIVRPTYRDVGHSGLEADRETAAATLVEDRVACAVHASGQEGAGRSGSKVNMRQQDSDMSGFHPTKAATTPSAVLPPSLTTSTSVTTQIGAATGRISTKREAKEGDPVHVVDDKCTAPGPSLVSPTHMKQRCSASGSRLRGWVEEVGATTVGLRRLTKHCAVESPPPARPKSPIEPAPEGSSEMSTPSRKFPGSAAFADSPFASTAHRAAFKAGISTRPQPHSTAVQTVTPAPASGHLDLSHGVLQGHGAKLGTKATVSEVTVGVIGAGSPGELNDGIGTVGRWFMDEAKVFLDGGGRDLSELDDVEVLSGAAAALDTAACSIQAAAQVEAGKASVIAADLSTYRQSNAGQLSGVQMAEAAACVDTSVNGNGCGSCPAMGAFQYTIDRAQDAGTTYPQQRGITADDVDITHSSKRLRRAMGSSPEPGDTPLHVVDGTPDPGEQVTVKDPPGGNTAVGHASRRCSRPTPPDTSADRMVPQSEQLTAGAMVGGRSIRYVHSVPAPFPNPERTIPKESRSQRVLIRSVPGTADTEPLQSGGVSTYLKSTPSASASLCTSLTEPHARAASAATAVAARAAMTPGPVPEPVATVAATKAHDASVSSVSGIDGMALASGANAWLRSTHKLSLITNRDPVESNKAPMSIAGGCSGSMPATSEGAANFAAQDCPGRGSDIGSGNSASTFTDLASLVLGLRNWVMDPLRDGTAVEQDTEEGDWNTNGGIDAEDSADELVGYGSIGGANGLDDEDGLSFRGSDAPRLDLGKLDDLGLSGKGSEETVLISSPHFSIYDNAQYIAVDRSSATSPRPRYRNNDADPPGASCAATGLGNMHSHIIPPSGSKGGAATSTAAAARTDALGLNHDMLQAGYEARAVLASLLNAADESSLGLHPTREERHKAAKAARSMVSAVPIQAPVLTRATGANTQATPAEPTPLGNVAWATEGLHDRLPQADQASPRKISCTAPKWKLAWDEGHEGGTSDTAAVGRVSEINGGFADWRHTSGGGCAGEGVGLGRARGDMGQGPASEPQTDMIVAQLARELENLRNTFVLDLKRRVVQETEAAPACSVSGEGGLGRGLGEGRYYDKNAMGPGGRSVADVAAGSKPAHRSIGGDVSRRWSDVE